jgi:hypothetical protein
MTRIFFFFSFLLLIVFCLICLFPFQKETDDNRWLQTSPRNANPKGGKIGRIIIKKERKKDVVSSCKQMQEGDLNITEKFPAG